jgi:acetaldehyde/propanal dehydrogenase
MNRAGAAIVGSGNIGTDLLMKALRSESIEPKWMVGIEPGSDGLARARELGLRTTHEGVDGLLPHLEADGVRIAFDATSAYAHAENSKKLTSRGVRVVDLTPCAIGPYCVPPVNLEAHIGSRAMNVNMVTCGGQATIPIVAAVSRVQAVSYAEIVATVSSRSAGPGTRNNIDEFTRTTARGVESVGGAARGKAIIILNPAEPPLIMRDTIHCLTEREPDEGAITESILAMAREVQRYVPGNQINNGACDAARPRSALKSRPAIAASICFLVASETPVMGRRISDEMTPSEASAAFTGCGLVSTNIARVSGSTSRWILRASSSLPAAVSSTIACILAGTRLPTTEITPTPPSAITGSTMPSSPLRTLSPVDCRMSATRSSEPDASFTYWKTGLAFSSRTSVGISIATDVRPGTL